MSPQTQDIHQAVLEVLGETRPAAIFLLDIEAILPSAQEQPQPVLRRLNSSRELWERLSCPVVFRLAAYAAALVATKAPDFWRYRSHQFEFVPEPAETQGLSAALKETFPGFPAVDALSFDEKLFRQVELEQRLREAGVGLETAAVPAMELLPHVLCWIHELAYLYR